MVMSEVTEKQIMEKAPRPVVIRKRRYADIAIAARELGVSPKTIENAIYRGALDTVGLGRWRQGTPTMVHGKIYPSQSAAGRALGVTQQTVFCALERGTQDRIGKGARG